MNYRLGALAVVGLGLAARLALGAIPDQMHPDFDIKSFGLPDSVKTMGLGFLSDGRMAVVTTDSIGGGEVPKAPGKTHRVLIVTDPGGANQSVKEIANTWLLPAGLTIVNDKLYISDRDGFYQINSLTPAAGDLAGNRTKIASWPDSGTFAFGKSWHQFVFDPVYWQGNFYAPYSGSIRPGGWSDVNQTTSYSGAFLKWDLTGKLNKHAGGLRSPNGVNINPAGEMFVADNQGSWLPSSTFMHIKEGKFYGHKQSQTRDATGTITAAHPANWAESLPYERPTAWLDHGNLRASPSQPIYMDKGTFAGDWLLGDINNPGLVRIALDDVEGTYNGAVFWFGKGTGNAAINRLAWGKDGSLYIGSCNMIGGNWPDKDRRAPFFKVTPKTSTSFDMKSVRSLADGVEIEFTTPVNSASITIENFPVAQWNYTRKEEYGQGKGTSEKRTVSATEISADGKRVHLKVAGLKDDYVTYIKLNAAVKSASGASPWNNETWFTLNKISTRTWNGSTGIAQDSKVGSSLNALVRSRVSPAGVIVTLDLPGRVDAVLRGLNGAALRTANGSGTLLVPTQGLSKGVYLLEVIQGAEKLVRPVTLSY